MLSTAVLNYWLRQGRDRPQPSNRPEAGLTLLECIVAMVMMSIVAVAITPPLFLATASRVQSNRAEQATQIAQGEIDKVRVLIERGEYMTNPGGVLPQEGSEEIEKTPAPNPVPELSALESTREKCDTKVAFLPASSLRPVDIDGDCQPDFAVQTFRTPASNKNSVTTTAGLVLPVSFSLGVRVWAYQPLKTNTKPLATSPASLQLTTGTGEQGMKPLAVMYTQITRSDSKVSYEKLCQSMGGTDGCTIETPPEPNP